MDAVAFPPPPAPFRDDDVDFGDFTFATKPAPQQPLADPRPATFAAFDDDWGDFVASPIGSNQDASAQPTSTASSWERPRGPLPLSLFGADDHVEDGREEEGPAGPPTTTTAHQRAPSSADGSRPADLKDLIAGLYGSQPPSAAGAVDAGAREGAEDDDGFGDDGWEFKAATASPAGQDGGGRAHGDGIEKMEDITRSLGSDHEDWSSFTSVDEKSNHVQTTDLIGTHESTEECVKASRCSPASNAAILNLYKESELADANHIAQSSAESVQSSSDLFSNNEMNSSFETDENHSIRSTSDSSLIEFYHRLREESLTVISRHMKDLKETQKSSMLFDENSKATEIGREIQEIYDKLKNYSLPEGFCTEECPLRDVCTTELVNSIKDEHLKDFEQEYRLVEKIARAMEDTNVALELYKHSVSTLHTLGLASKEEQCDYVGAWYNMLLSCAQELHHGVALWQQSCQANVCNRVISEGTNILTSAHSFIALGEIYRVAQILYFSLQCFKPWVLADPGMLSKMLSCLDSCSNAWTSGLETALQMVADSNCVDAPVAKALMESIKNINELEVCILRNFLPSDEMLCRLTLLPTSLVPGMKVITWNGDHYFVKVANLWANRISSDSPQLSRTPVSSMNNATPLTHHVE
ncbi:uncharacterized protein LOC133905855 isoform X2 [Phragmites australis]|uniref:uncharacterized protein LOC133905855 isoform X2 n=1 Tax=Phragmites australis TaxID=29695 RepID=UPI002D7689FE|nr:uncharacterized protein LOC133905855 isoform X2 [Phragmites australis]